MENFNSLLNKIIESVKDIIPNNINCLFVLLDPNKQEVITACNFSEEKMRNVLQQAINKLETHPPQPLVTSEDAENMVKELFKNAMGKEI